MRRKRNHNQTRRSILANQWQHDEDEENNSYEYQTLSDGEYCRKRVKERGENLQVSHIYTETIIKKFYIKYYKRNI